MKTGTEGTRETRKKEGTGRKRGKVGGNKGKWGTRARGGQAEEGEQRNKGNR